MNHVARFQVSAAGDCRISNGNAADFVALLLNRRPTLAIDCAGYSGTENQIVIRGVDDGVDIHLGDIALLDYDSVGDGIHWNIVRHSAGKERGPPIMIFLARRIFPPGGPAPWNCARSNRAPRDPSFAPGGLPAQIAAANGSAGIFRRACCEDILGSSGEHRVPPDPPSQTVPRGDSAPAEWLCR